jgi:LPS-assembly protein
MTFERSTSFFGLDAIQTLEPRIYYLNVPYRDQSNLPVYDTTLSDFSFSQAFQENIYTGGWDRIANANQLTLALGSRLLDEETGFERAAFAVGQRIYFVDQLVTLPGETPRTDVRSEFLINATAALTDTLSASIDLQYNPYDGDWDRAQIVARFNPKRAATLSASYRYQRTPTGAFQPQGQEQISLAFQWPLTANIYSVGRVDYSLLNIPARDVVPRVTQAIAGLEYRGDCCWAARVVYQRYAIDPNAVNDAIFFQLELSGLGRLGQDPMGLLSNSIPNFQNITPAIKPVGKFERYE